jgi:hypothetical protein
MNDPMELTKEITVAWLGAYQTDLAVRRQKGIVPLFTPTSEEVMEFISSTHAKISQLSEKSLKNSAEDSAKTKKKAK